MNLSNLFRSLLLSAQLLASIVCSADDHFSEVGLPTSPSDTQILHRKAYSLSYDPQLRTPRWVMWCLTADHAYGNARRPKYAWHEDTDVSTPRATFADYRQPNVDKSLKWTKGHLCPAADNKWDETAMYESFLLTNCCPQSAALNSGRWNKIESDCRAWARQYGAVYIVSGPLYLKGPHELIGQNKIAVPEAFYKGVIRLGADPCGIAFVCRNTHTSQPRDQYVNTISEVERLTGITFFPNLPTDIAQIVKNSADTKRWKSFKKSNEKY